MAKKEPKFTHHLATAPDGGKLSYYTTGSGPSLLVVHGASNYALTYDDLAVVLSPYYTVHTVSRRGRGLSSPYPASVTALNLHHEPAGSKAGDTDAAGESASMNGARTLSPPGPEDTFKIGSKNATRVYSPAFASAVLETDTSDLETLVAATQAEFVIAVSSGALVTLQALLLKPDSPSLATLRKAIIFEPPIFFTDQSSACDIGKLHLFEQELTAGETTGAAVTAMHMIELGPTWIPKWLMKTLAGMLFRAQEKDVAKRRAAGEEDRGVCTMGGLTRLIRFDFAVVEGMVGESARFARLQKAEQEPGGHAVELMLLSGAKSPSWLRGGMETLGKAMPDVKRTVVEGVGHELLCHAEMRGQPAKAVPPIHDFFQ